MKKLLLLMLLTVFVSSCGDNTSNEVRQFVTDLSSAIQRADMAAVTQAYPDAAQADSISISFIPDSLKVKSSEDGKTIFVQLNNGADLTIARSDDGTMQVLQSHGLFCYPAQRMALAMGTGQYDPALDDAANAQRMADHGFLDFVAQKFANDIKGKLVIAGVKTYGDDYYDGEWIGSAGYIFTVKNNAEVNIPGSLYEIVYKSGYWGGGPKTTEIIAGADVAAGSTVQLRSVKMGPNMESEDTYSIRIKPAVPEQILAIYQPTGHEYESYLAAKPQP